MDAVVPVFRILYLEGIGIRGEGSRRRPGERSARVIGIDDHDVLQLQLGTILEGDGDRADGVGPGQFERGTGSDIKVAVGEMNDSLGGGGQSGDEDCGELHDCGDCRVLRANSKVRE